MQQRARQPRAKAWTAIAVLLLAALLPLLLSTAQHSVPAAAWAEICSAGSNDRSPGQPASGDDLPQLPHCPLCTLQAHAPALPPPPAALMLLRAGLSFAPPEHRLGTPFLVATWRSAQPRAPPFLV